MKISLHLPNKGLRMNQSLKTLVQHVSEEKHHKIVGEWHCMDSILTLGKILKASLRVNCDKGEIQTYALVAHPTIISNLLADLQALRRYDDSPDYSLDYSHSDATIMLRYGDCYLVPSDTLPLNKAYLVGLKPHISPVKINIQIPKLLDLTVTQDLSAIELGESDLSDVMVLTNIVSY